MELMTMTMIQDHPKGDYKQSPHGHGLPFHLDTTVSDGIKKEIFYDQSLLDSDGNDQATMRKLVNKLGGTYCSGKPLSLAIRRQIVAMADSGMKACDISRQLQISHGCVSKIITKWRSTGSFEPRRIGGSKPKKTIGDVVAAVRMYKRSCPTIRSLEIRRKLLEDGVCNECNVPSLSSINRIIRMKLRDDLAEYEANAVRDLMTLLATSAMPVSQAESHAPQLVARPTSPVPVSPNAHSQDIRRPTVLMGSYPPLKPQAHLPPPQNHQFDRGLAFRDAKFQSLPAALPTFLYQPDVMSNKLSELHSGLVPRNRCARNISITSTSSTSSYASDGSYETWCEEMASGANSDNEDPRGMSTQFVNGHDLMNLNFDNDDLWSLLDELP